METKQPGGSASPPVHDPIFFRDQWMEDSPFTGKKLVSLIGRVETDNKKQRVVFEITTRTKLQATLPWTHSNAVTLSKESIKRLFRALADNKETINLQIEKMGEEVLTVIESLTEEQYRKLERGNVVAVQVDE